MTTPQRTRVIKQVLVLEAQCRCGSTATRPVIIPGTTQAMLCAGVADGQEHPIRGLVIMCTTCHRASCVDCVSMRFAQFLDGDTTDPPWFAEAARHAEEHLATMGLLGKGEIGHA